MEEDFEHSNNIPINDYEEDIEHYKEDNDKLKINEEEEENIDEKNSSDSTEELLQIIFPDKDGNSSNQSTPQKQKRKQNSQSPESTSSSKRGKYTYNITRPVPEDHVAEFPPKQVFVKKEADNKPIKYAGSKEFEERQAEILERRKKIRSQTPTERGFETLYTPPQKEYLNHEYVRVTPHHQDNYESKTPAKPYIEDLFRQSVKKPVVAEEEPLPELYRANKTSLQIARDRNQEVIAGIIGFNKVVKERRFILIMKKFNISNIPDPEDPDLPKPLISQVKDLVRISDDEYDAVRLKEIMIAASNGDNSSPLYVTLRPTVNAAISNMRSFVVPRKSPKRSQNSQASTPRSQKSSQNTPSKSGGKNHRPSTSSMKSELSNTNNDGSTKNSEKPKQPTPKQNSAKGAKYFPGFYDNLEIYPPKRH